MKRFVLLFSLLCIVLVASCVKNPLNTLEQNHSEDISAQVIEQGLKAVEPYIKMDHEKWLITIDSQQAKNAAYLKIT